MDTKSILKSKTFWFNIALGALALVEKTVSDLGITDGLLVTVLTIGNLLLRTITGTPVRVVPK